MATSYPHARIRTVNPWKDSTIAGNNRTVFVAPLSKKLKKTTSATKKKANLGSNSKTIDAGGSAVVPEAKAPSLEVLGAENMVSELILSGKKYSSLTPYLPGTRDL